MNCMSKHFAAFCDIFLSTGDINSTALRRTPLPFLNIQVPVSLCDSQNTFCVDTGTPAPRSERMFLDLSFYHSKQRTPQQHSYSNTYPACSARLHAFRNAQDKGVHFVTLRARVWPVSHVNGIRKLLLVAARKNNIGSSCDGLGD